MSFAWINLKFAFKILKKCNALQDPSRKIFKYLCKFGLDNMQSIIFFLKTMDKNLLL